MQIQKTFGAFKEKTRDLWSGKEILYEAGSSTFKMKARSASGSGLIVLAQGYSFNLANTPSPRLICYPELEDIEIFSRSSESLTPQSPSSLFPGAVGVLSYTPFDICGSSIPSLKGRSDVYLNPHLNINFIQGCFRIGSPPAVEPNRARIYGGWKRRLIECIFEIAKESDIHLVVFYNSNIGIRGFPADFEKISSEMGYSFSIFGDIHQIPDKNIFTRTEVALIED